MTNLVRGLPMAGSFRVMASAARPAPLAMPARKDVQAYAPPSAFERWTAGLRAAGDVGVNVITIYDVIGEDFWTGGGVTVKRVDAALRAIGKQDVEVHINSPGGDMFEGVAILNRLLQHPASVTVKVMGLAASAASIVAMAGDELLMGPASFLMIHNAWVLAAGNRHEMRDVADFLEPFDDAMAGLYAGRAGKEKKWAAKLMDAETWLNGDQAVAEGLADAVLEPAAMTEDTQATARQRDLNAARRIEALLGQNMSRSDARGLTAAITGAPPAVAGPADEPPAGDDWLGAAAQLLADLKAR